MKVDLDELKKQLDSNEIINIIKTLVPDLRYEETNSYLILPTICHNKNSEDASMKLYYYFNTHLFFCYTECNSSFDIYELVKKILDLRDMPSDFTEVFNIITRNTDKIYNLNEEEVEEKYHSFLDRYEKKNQNVNFNIYNKELINFFEDYIYRGWLDEGISIKSMEKYYIRYSVSREQVIIPHFDIDGNLIGIRGRNLNDFALLNGKYMPVKIEGKFYSHPLSYNLYGLNFTKESIARKKIVFIFEGEKSTLLSDSWYDENSVAVSTCGNKLNKFQVNLLMKLGVREAIICYDRMNKDRYDDSYFNKLYSLCKKYSNYMNFSFIYDRNCILEYKAAPVDSGKETFEKLLQQRVVVK